MQTGGTRRPNLVGLAQCGIFNFEQGVSVVRAAENHGKSSAITENDVVEITEDRRFGLDSIRPMLWRTMLLSTPRADPEVPPSAEMWSPDGGGGLLWDTMKVLSRVKRHGLSLALWYVTWLQEGGLAGVSHTPDLDVTTAAE